MELALLWNWPALKRHEAISDPTRAPTRWVGNLDLGTSFNVIVACHVATSS